MIKFQTRTSDIKKYQTCQYSWILTRFFNKTEDVKKSAEIGTRLHKDLENWFLEGTRSAVVDTLEARGFGHVLERIDEIKVEAPVLYEKNPNWNLHGTIDYFRDLGDGKVLIRDWKTSSNPKKHGETNESLPFNMQLNNYALLLHEAFGYEKFVFEHVQIQQNLSYVNVVTCERNLEQVLKAFKIVEKTIDKMKAHHYKLVEQDAQVTDLMPEAADTRRCKSFGGSGTCSVIDWCMHYNIKNGGPVKATREKLENSKKVTVQPEAQPEPPPAFQEGEAEELLIRIQETIGAEFGIEEVDAALKKMGKPALMELPPEKRVQAIDYLASPKGRVWLVASRPAPVATNPTLITGCFMLDRLAALDVNTMLFKIEQSICQDHKIAHSMLLSYNGYRQEYVMRLTRLFRETAHASFFYLAPGNLLEAEVVTAFSMVFPEGNRIMGQK